MTRKSLVFIIAALSVTITLVMLAQTSSQFPELDKNGKPLLPRPLPHLVYSPADLAHSGVTLPASIGGATTSTSLIRVGDATKMTVFVTYSQNFDLVPTIQILLETVYNSNQFSVLLYSAICSKLTIATKQEDFIIPEFDFEAFANAAGQVIDIYSNE